MANRWNEWGVQKRIVRELSLLRPWELHTERGGFESVIEFRPPLRDRIFPNAVPILAPPETLYRVGGQPTHIPSRHMSIAPIFSPLRETIPCYRIGFLPT